MHHKQRLSGHQMWSAIGIAITWSNSGGILASFTFLACDAKNFLHNGFLKLMICLIGAMVISLWLL